MPRRKGGLVKGKWKGSVKVGSRSKAVARANGRSQVDRVSISRDSEFYCRTVVAEMLPVSRNIFDFPYDRSCRSGDRWRAHK